MRNELLFIYPNNSANTMAARHDDDNTKAKRVTIMIARDVDKKVRVLQAAEIKKTGGTCSFSTMMDMVLRKQLKL